MTVTNSIRQVTSGFTVTKRVIGEGRRGLRARHDVRLQLHLHQRGHRDVLASPTATSFSTAAPIPAFTTCTVTETSQPPVSAAYGWDPVEFTVSGPPRPQAPR